MAFMHGAHLHAKSPLQRSGSAPNIHTRLAEASHLKVRCSPLGVPSREQPATLQAFAMRP